MATPQGKRIFMTGASGYIGSAITELALAEGYSVHGLSRFEKSDAKMRSLGATPIRGDLFALDVIERESRQADVVIHLADSWLGPDGKMRDYDEVIKIDGAAVDAMASGLKGTEKPLIITSGTLVVSPDPSGAETTESSPLNPNPFNQRIKCEQHALTWTEKGVRVCAVRLAPYVYGRGASGIRMVMQMAFAGTEAVYVGDGSTRTSTVHVEDAASLFILAAKKAKAGDIFNGTSSTNVTAKQLAEAMGAVLELPVRSKTFEEAQARVGPILARFLIVENRASNAKAVQELGWKPKQRGVLEDIREGSYVAVAEELKKGVA